MSQVRDDPGTLVTDQLVDRVSRCFPEWTIGDVETAGAGLDFEVLRIETDEVGAVAVRCARRAHISNAIDPAISARRLLQQETILLEHARRVGLPAPQVHGLCLTDEPGSGPDALVMEWVDGDGSDHDIAELGDVLRRLHDAPVPAISPVMQTEASVALTLAERLTRRARFLDGIEPLGAPIPSEDDIAGPLAEHLGPVSLNHLDARQDNLCTSGGEIRAVLDWSNTLIGDPRLELARLCEFGYVAPGHELHPDFLDAYGEHRTLDELPRPVELMFRLDTAVMLGVLFSVVAPAPVRAAYQFERSRALFDELAGCRT